MFSAKDRDILRTLAVRIREISELPIMAERRRQWRAMNDLRSERPMVLVGPEGAWQEIYATIPLQCEDLTAREQERWVRQTIYQHEHISDDSIVDAVHTVQPWTIHGDGYGVEFRDATTGVQGGAVKHIPPLKNLPDDLGKLRHQTFTVDRHDADRIVQQHQELFGDILTVRASGCSYYYWTTGLTITAIAMIGLEEMMMLMVDDPDSLKALMQFLSDDMMSALKQLESLGVLGLNAASNGIGSGNLGWVSDLPASVDQIDGPVKLKHLWGLSESQETVGVSPEMFAEFIWPYQKPLMELFGLTYYGCCEPVETRFQWIRQAKNLRCISVSPWSDVRRCAELYQRDYVLCRKPHPGLVCVAFDEEAIRKDIRETLDVAGELNLAFVLKDTHTISHQPERFGRWVQIVREEISR